MSSNDKHMEKLKRKGKRSKKQATFNMPLSGGTISLPPSFRPPLSPMLSPDLSQYPHNFLTIPGSQHMYMPDMGFLNHQEVGVNYMPPPGLHYFGPTSSTNHFSIASSSLSPFESSTPSISRLNLGGSTVPDSPPTPTQAPPTPTEAPTTAAIIIDPRLTSTYDNLHRLNIFPDGTNGFLPSKATKKVMKSVSNLWNGPWPTYRSVPKDVQLDMFRKFRTLCAWDQEYERRIQECFENNVALSIKVIFSTYRKDGERPAFVNQVYWDQMLVHWDTEEYKAKCEQAKKTRASTKPWEAAPSEEDPEQWRNKKWVEPCAFNTFYGFGGNYNAWRSSQLALQGCSNGYMLTPELETQRWLETVCRMTNKYAYGFVGEPGSSGFNAGLPPRTPIMATKNENEELRNRVAVLEKEVAKIKKLEGMLFKRNREACEDDSDSENTE